VRASDEVEDVQPAHQPAAQQQVVVVQQNVPEQQPVATGGVRPATTYEDFGLPNTNVIVRDGHELSVIMDGRVRHIPSMDVLNRCFNTEKVNQAGDGKAAKEALGVGEPLAEDSYLLKGNGQPEVFLVENGVRRWISSGQVFELSAFDWGKVVHKPDEEVDALNYGLPISQGPDGVFFRNTETQACYLLINGTLRHIPSMEAYDRVFSVPMGEATWQSFPNHTIIYPIGSPLGANFSIIKGSEKEHCYILDGDKKHHISDSEVFTRHQFDWGKVKHLPQAEVDPIPEGYPQY